MCSINNCQKRYFNIISIKGWLSDFMYFKKEFTSILNKQSIYFIHPNSVVENDC